MESPAAESPTSAGRNRAENMSHEELVKMNKKQLIFLQKLKGKCDDLQSKLSAQSDYDQLKVQLSSAGEERCRVKEELEQVRLREAEVTRSNRAMSEELDCLKQKQETLLSSLQYLQSDHDKTVVERKSLIGKMKLIVQDKNKTNERLSEVEMELQDAKDQVEDKNQQLRALKEHIKSLKDSEEKSSENRGKIMKENKELKNELAASKISLDMYKKSSESNKKDTEKIKCVEKEMESLKVGFEKAKVENESLRGKIAELESFVNDQSSKVEAASQKHAETSQQLDLSAEHQMSWQEKLTQLKRDFEGEKVVLKDEFEKAKSELSENFAAKLNDASASLESALKERDSLISDNSKLQTELLSMQSSIASDCGKNEGLSDEVLSLNEKLVVADADLEKSSDELSKHKQMFAEASRRFAGEKEVLLQDFNEKLAELNEKMSANENEMVGLRSDIDAQKEENARLKAEYDAAVTSCEVTITDLREQLQTKDQQIRSVQGDADAKRLLDEMRGVYDAAAAECGQLKQRLSEERQALAEEEKMSLKNDIEEVNETARGLQGEKEDLLEKLKNTLESNGSLTHSNIELNDELRDMKEAHKRECDKLVALREDVHAQLAKQRDELEEKVKLFEERNEEGAMEQKKVEKLQLDVESKQEELAECENEITYLRERVEDIQSEKQASCEKLRAVDEEMRGLRDENKSLSHNCHSLEEEIQSLKADRESSLKDVASAAEMEAVELKGEIEELNTKLSESKTKYVQLSESASGLENLRSNLRQQNEDLESRLKEKDAALQTLIEKLETIQREQKLNEEAAEEDAEKLEEEKLRKVSDEVESLRKKVVELKESLQNQLLINENQAQSLSELQGNLGRSGADNIRIQGLLDEANALGRQKQEEYRGLERRFREIEESLKCHEDSLQKSSKEIRVLEESLSAAKHRHEEEMESLRLEHSNEVHTLQAECSQFSNRCDILQQEIAKKQNDYEEINKSIADKQSLINQLNDANSELQTQLKLATSELDALKSETSQAKLQEGSKIEIESLQQRVKEKESYSAKLKVIAVKAKKELDVVKLQLQSALDEKAQLQTRASDLNSQLLGSQARVMSGVQTMQAECDRLQDQIDQTKSEKAHLVKTIEENNTLVAQLQTQKEEISSKHSSLLIDSERLRGEKQELERALATFKLNFNKLEKEKEAAVKEKNMVAQEMQALKIQLSSLSKQVEDEQQQLSAAQTSLQQANKSIQQHDLLSLEMAQYEATLCGLQTQVSDLEVIVREKDEKVNELERKVIELNEDRRAIEELRVDAEERVTRTKEILDGTRDQVARLSEVEHECKGQLDAMTEQYEFVQQQYEDCKVDLASKTSECQQLEEKIVSAQSLNHKSAQLMQRKLIQKEEDLEKLSKERDALQSDYENYKVRVHSVLKQQKSKEKSEQDDSGDGKLASMKKKLSQIHLKLVDTQNILASRDHELDLLQGDYDRLLRQQQQSSEGALERETRWKSRVKTLQQELVALRKQYDDVTFKLAQLHDVTAASVSSAVERVKADHEAEMESLRAELKRREEELAQIRNELRKVEEKPAATPKRATPSPSVYRPHVSVEAAVDYRSVARESGEGEEQPDDDSVMSFEQILQTPRIHSVTEMLDNVSVTSEVQVKQLEAKVLAQSKQLEHSTEVARESEATALRLADQNKVLKEEIRRLEKNQERDKSVSNMEYLKNVVYKFLTLPPCAEKTHLIPVLDTMLRLSQEERAVVEALAAGGDAEEAQPSGWGSYLQRWSGMQ